MSAGEGQIVHVSDTALMVAACRALETARPDGFINDPFAERLAGARGMAIARGLPGSGFELMCFGMGVRSRLIDELISESVRTLGIATVACVGSGLDTRPWRLDLPADLRWVEVDFQDMLDYKAGLMAGERPKCRLERVTADLNDVSQRRAMFAAIGNAPALMVTEGLLGYLPADTVQALAVEPAAMSGIRYWLMDITTLAFSRLLHSDTWQSVENVRDPSHLDGEQMIGLFERHGWVASASRRYAAGIDFAAGRIRKMMKIPDDAPLPPPMLPDDPTGVHLFARS